MLENNKCCCKVKIIIYEPGYTRRSAYDKTGNLRQTVSAWQGKQGKGGACIQIEYAASSNEILQALKNLPNGSVSNLDYLGHSSEGAIFPEYGSNKGKNDGSIDANNDGLINGDDATSEDPISDSDFSDAMKGKFEPTGNFNHLGCNGSSCAVQMNKQHNISAIGASGRTNYNPAGAGGRPERMPSGVFVPNYPQTRP